MAHLIDKSALATWIEKRIKETESMQPKFDQFWAGQISAFKGILKILDILEVKEVDLEKEIDKWWCSLYTDYSMKRAPNHKFVPEPSYMDSNFKQSETGKTKIAFALDIDWKVDSNDIEWDADTVREFAKHFFELGLKAQKGE